MTKKLSVGILGSRGIPNNYGGFEEFAGELGKRLVKKGHQVAVYTVHDHPLKDSFWEGIERIRIRDPHNFGSFGQFIYDLLCNLDSRKRDFDIILHLGYTSDSVLNSIWAEGKVHITNMDGMEWKRTKFSPPVQRFLLRAERLATIKSRYLVADSEPIRNYLAGKYQIPVRYITYGAEIPGDLPYSIPESYGFQPAGYDLIIARMEPENNIEPAILGKLRSAGSLPLVIIGNKNKYRKYLEAKYGDNPRIRFVGPLYDKKTVNALRKHCRFYIHGHSVGGTNPSLLEAMACGCRILSHDNPFNRSVLGMDARYFKDEKDLPALLNSKKGILGKESKNNLEKVRKKHNWDKITDEYEKLFYEAVGIT